MDNRAFPISYAAILTEVAIEHGVDKTELWSQASLDVAIMTDAEAHLTPSQLQELLSKAFELSKQPALCLYFGEHLSLTAHGVLGYALMSCRNIEQAIELLIKYQRLLMDVDSLEVNQYQDTITIEYRRHSSALMGHREDCEIFFAGMVSAVKHLLHREDFNCTVELDYPAPDYALHYRDMLGSDIRFDSERCCVSFSAHWLQEQPVYANPVMLQLYENQCQQLLTQMEASQGLAAKTRKYLIARPQFPSLQQTADHFHLSARTFRRRLEEEQTSFQDILDEVRQQLAKTYLQDSEFSVQHTAELLGFHDVSNFRRAFIRWTGVSPAAFKKQ